MQCFFYQYSPDDIITTFNNLPEEKLSQCVPIYWVSPRLLLRFLRQNTVDIDFVPPADFILFLLLFPLIIFTSKNQSVRQKISVLMFLPTRVRARSSYFFIRLLEAQRPHTSSRPAALLKSQKRDFLSIQCIIAGCVTPPRNWNDLLILYNETNTIYFSRR